MGMQMVAGQGYEQQQQGAAGDDWQSRMFEQMAGMSAQIDRKSTRLNSSHRSLSRMPSSA